jgi:transposase-like protein
VPKCEADVQNSICEVCGTGGLVDRELMRPWLNELESNYHPYGYPLPAERQYGQPVRFGPYRTYQDPSGYG